MVSTLKLVWHAAPEILCRNAVEAMGCHQIYFLGNEDEDLSQSIKFIWI